jgi:hypothetical protein
MSQPLHQLMHMPLFRKIVKEKIISYNTNIHNSIYYIHVGSYVCCTWQNCNTFPAMPSASSMSSSTASCGIRQRWASGTSRRSSSTIHNPTTPPSNTYLTGGHGQLHTPADLERLWGVLRHPHHWHSHGPSGRYELGFLYMRYGLVMIKCMCTSYNAIIFLLFLYVSHLYYLCVNCYWEILLQFLQSRPLETSTMWKGTGWVIRAHPKVSYGMDCVVAMLFLAHQLSQACELF